jgi:hypothetical protein
MTFTETRLEYLRYEHRILTESAHTVASLEIKAMLLAQAAATRRSIATIKAGRHLSTLTR